MSKKSPIDKLLAPISNFIHLEYTSGIVLLVAVLVAVVWANSDFGASYHLFWETSLSIGFGNALLDQPLHIWINDGLMALFFFVIGLELKREFIDGELSTLSKAILPMTAALGGMLIPALLYVLINMKSNSIHGWGIPMATDIAFALAILSMAGKHIPTSVKVFLSALAVADDLGAVLVIAFFYTADVNFIALGVAAIFLLLMLIGNLTGVRNNLFYLVLGLCVWLGFLFSGVHATIAGVLVAFCIPARTKINTLLYSDTLKKLNQKFDQQPGSKSSLISAAQHQAIYDIKKISEEAETPLQKIEHALHPWVAFLIMPLFALSNSGIHIGFGFFAALADPVALGVLVGLVIGKFSGIILFTWLMVKARFAKLPKGASWKHMIGVGLLGGIGFTMSMFISGLAFDDADHVEKAKYGIFMASIVAGISGIAVLRQKVQGL